MCVCECECLCVLERERERGACLRVRKRERETKKDGTHNNTREQMCTIACCIVFVGGFLLFQKCQIILRGKKKASFFCLTLSSHMMA